MALAWFCEMLSARFLCLFFILFTVGSPIGRPAAIRFDLRVTPDRRRSNAAGCTRIGPIQMYKAETFNIVEAFKCRRLLV